MTSYDNIHSTSSINLDTIWTAPAKARRGRPTKTIGKIELRIESIVMGVLVGGDGYGDYGQPCRMEDLTAITGYTAAQIRPIMQRLVAAGVVRRTGNTRGTRYQAVGL